MRLNKFLSKSGIASRRKSDELIKMATTTVNEEIILDPAYNVKEKDLVRFDGRLLKIDEEKIVIILNKPKNVITSVSDQFGRKTVMHFIKSKKRLAPIGRLDKDSTGLLLLTNDGDLHQYLTHPKNQIPRQYIVVIEKIIDSSKLKRITRGLSIGEGEIGKARVISQKMIKGRCEAKLELKQGKKREVRRIFRSVKIKLFSLHRVSFGSINIGSLQTGESRFLEENEIKNLKNKN
jgi:pseudouridine synthase